VTYAKGQLWSGNEDQVPEDQSTASLNDPQKIQMKNGNNLAQK